MCVHSTHWQQEEEGWEVEEGEREKIDNPVDDQVSVQCLDVTWNMRDNL